LREKVNLANGPATYDKKKKRLGNLWSHNYGRSRGKRLKPLR